MGVTAENPRRAVASSTRMPENPDYGIGSIPPIRTAIHRREGRTDPNGCRRVPSAAPISHPPRGRLTMARWSSTAVAVNIICVSLRGHP